MPLLNQRKVKVLVVGAAAALLIADCILTFIASQDAAASIAWGRIAVAIAIQLLVIPMFVGGLVLQSEAHSRNGATDASYRARFPVTLIGIVLVLTALSLDLLYTAIVCPGTAIPIVRGHPMC